MKEEANLIHCNSSVGKFVPNRFCEQRWKCFPSIYNNNVFSSSYIYLFQFTNFYSLSVLDRSLVILLIYIYIYKYCNKYFYSIVISCFCKLNLHLTIKSQYLVKMLHRLMNRNFPGLLDSIYSTPIV